MPRIAGLLLAQATRRGRSGTAGLALSPRAPAQPVHPLVFHFLRRSALSQQRAGSSIDAEQVPSPSALTAVKSPPPVSAQLRLHLP